MRIQNLILLIYSCITYSKSQDKPLVSHNNTIDFSNQSSNNAQCSIPPKNTYQTLLTKQDTCAISGAPNDHETALVTAAQDLYSQSILAAACGKFPQFKFLFNLLPNKPCKDENSFLTAFLYFSTQTLKYLQIEMFSTDWHLIDDIKKFHNYTVEKSKQDTQIAQELKALKAEAVNTIDAIIIFFKQNKNFKN